MSNKSKISYSLITLTNLSTEALYEIESCNDYDEKTRRLARRAINARSC